MCRSLFHGAIKCLECDSPYCSVECLQADSVHAHQCKILQSSVPCAFCLDPITCAAEGFVQTCGHGLHASCASISEHYGLQGCAACPASNALTQMGRLMLLEYARLCYTAIRVGLAMPDIPLVLLKFLASEGARSGAQNKDLLYMFGNIFANGLGVPADEQEAHKWLSRAAALGHGHAMFAVSGSSEERLRIAAARGSPHACFELATIPDELDESWLRKALVLAPFDVQSRKLLATHCEHTGRVPEALNHHFMMARQGHSESLERLARLYFDMSVDAPKYLIASSFWATQILPSPSSLKTQALIALRLKWDDKAFECMKRAAVGSCPASTDALYELARFYEQGVGTPVDAEQADKLMDRAAASGHPSALFDRAMKLFESDMDEAMKLVRKAAKSHAGAMHFLSRFDPSRELLETAGSVIPAALYDLALRYACAADLEDTEANYRKSVELLERALAMPPPTFDCAELDVDKTKSLLKGLRKRLAICDSLRTASMDTMLRLAQGSYRPVADVHAKQFTSSMGLLDIIECKLSVRPS